MAYESAIFSRSFSQRDQRKLGCWAFAIFLLVAVVTIVDVLKPYFSIPVPVLNLQLPTGAKLNMLIGSKETLEPQLSYYNIREAKPICNFTGKRSDICEMNGDIRIHGNSSTIFLIGSSNVETFNSTDSSWNLKPYARKVDSNAMRKVRTINIKTAHVSDSNIPICTKKYSIPAIVFSGGGYAGNQFHAFSDVLIPLFLTSIQFNGEVQLLATDTGSWWIEKHQQVLQKLSNYKPINMDQQNEVLCFPGTIVGLNATDKELGIHPSQSSHTMRDFRKLLRSAYSLTRESTNSIIKDHHEKGNRPRLLVISRKKTRRLINTGEIAATAESLGFDVVVQETGSTESEVSEFINSFDVLVGVHGAGLTNMVYLPDNALVIQIIPLGGMEWMARTFYENPARGMNLQYLEYKISPNEISLIQQYPNDHQVFMDPGAFIKNGWQQFKSVFMDKQDVKVDISRFREILLQAHQIFQTVQKTERFFNFFPFT